MKGWFGRNIKLFAASDPLLPVEEQFFLQMAGELGCQVVVARVEEFFRVGARETILYGNVLAQMEALVKTPVFAFMSDDVQGEVTSFVGKLRKVRLGQMPNFPATPTEANKNNL